MQTAIRVFNVTFGVRGCGQCLAGNFRRRISIFGMLLLAQLISDTKVRDEETFLIDVY